jgi:hypothetical protein
VLVDGNHEYEFALFDVMCVARAMRPGGLMVMDNIEQIGPRLAAITFLERNPDWRDVADVVRHIDPSAPFKVPTASFPDTKFYLLQAPPYYMIREEPRIFGPAEVDRAEVDGIELELAAPAQGRLHVLVYARTFSIAEPEELRCEQSLPLDFAQLLLLASPRRPVAPMPSAARCVVPESDGASSILSRQEEDALWEAFFTAAPARRRVFEPSSKRRKRAPGPLPLDIA